MALTGTELLAKVGVLGDVSESELVRGCGYVIAKNDGTDCLNTTAFYEALLEARGVKLGDRMPVTDELGRMALEIFTYKGATKAELTAVACQAVAILKKDSEVVTPEEDGRVYFWDLCVIGISAEENPSALDFLIILVDSLKESPALYALINEINAHIGIGRLCYEQELSEIRYQYEYPTDYPNPTVIADIIGQMDAAGDWFAYRITSELGGERFFDIEDDEIEI